RTSRPRKPRPTTSSANAIRPCSTPSARSTSAPKARPPTACAPCCSGPLGSRAARPLRVTDPLLGNLLHEVLRACHGRPLRRGRRSGRLCETRQPVFLLTSAYGAGGQRDRNTIRRCRRTLSVALWERLPALDRRHTLALRHGGRHRRADLARIGTRAVALRRGERTVLWWGRRSFTRRAAEELWYQLLNRAPSELIGHVLVGRKRLVAANRVAHLVDRHRGT